MTCPPRCTGKTLQTNAAQDEDHWFLILSAGNRQLFSIPRLTRSGNAPIVPGVCSEGKSFDRNDGLDKARTEMSAPVRPFCFAEDCPSATKHQTFCWICHRRICHRNGKIEEDVECARFIPGAFFHRQREASTGSLTGAAPVEREPGRTWERSLTPAAGMAEAVSSMQGLAETAEGLWDQEGYP